MPDGPVDRDPVDRDPVDRDAVERDAVDRDAVDRDADWARVRGLLQPRTAGAGTRDDAPEGGAGATESPPVAPLVRRTPGATGAGRGAAAARGLPATTPPVNDAEEGTS